MSTEIGPRDTAVPRPITEAIRLAVDVDPNLDVYIVPDEDGDSATKARAILVVEILKRKGVMPKPGEGPDLLHVMGALAKLRLLESVLDITNERPEQNDDKSRPAITHRSYRAKFERQSLRMQEDLAKRDALLDTLFFGRAA